MHSFQPQWIEFAAQAWQPLANHLWQATLTALLAWTLLRFVRPASARVRYAVLALALLRFVVPAAAVQL